MRSFLQPCPSGGVINASLKKFAGTIIEDLNLSTILINRRKAQVASKEMKILSIAALIIVAGGLSIAGQERVLTEAEFTEIHTKAQADLYRGVHGPFRQVLETAADTEARPEFSYRLKSVTKTVPGQGTHRVDERLVNGKSVKSEVISINNRGYLQTADGSWKELPDRPQNNVEAAKNPSTDSQTIERQAQFKYLGVETTGDRKEHVYSKFERRKTLNTTNGTTSESETTTKVRVSTTGEYYRFESDAKTLGSRGVAGTVRIVIEVAADPTITIKVPEISK